MLLNFIQIYCESLLVNRVNFEQSNRLEVKSSGNVTIEQSGILFYLKRRFQQFLSKPIKYIKQITPPILTIPNVCHINAHTKIHFFKQFWRIHINSKYKWLFIIYIFLFKFPSYCRFMQVYVLMRPYPKCKQIRHN